MAGVWLSLLVLMASPLWLWELNESWGTPAVARMLHERGVSGPVRIWQESERPSLNWYAGRRIRGANRSSDLRSGEDPGPELLSRQAPRPEELRCRQLEQGESLGLYRCRAEPASGDQARADAPQPCAPDIPPPARPSRAASTNLRLAGEPLLLAHFLAPLLAVLHPRRMQVMAGDAEAQQPGRLEQLLLGAAAAQVASQAAVGFGLVHQALQFNPAHQKGCREPSIPTLPRGFQAPRGHNCDQM